MKLKENWLWYKCKITYLSLFDYCTRNNSFQNAHPKTVSFRDKICKNVWNSGTKIVTYSKIIISLNFVQIPLYPPAIFQHEYDGEGMSFVFYFKISENYEQLPTHFQENIRVKSSFFTNLFFTPLYIDLNTFSNTENNRWWGGKGERIPCRHDFTM